MMVKIEREFTRSKVFSSNREINDDDETDTSDALIITAKIVASLVDRLQQLTISGREHSNKRIEEPERKIKKINHLSRSYINAG